MQLNLCPICGKTVLYGLCREHEAFAVLWSAVASGLVTDWPQAGASHGDIATKEEWSGYELPWHITVHNIQTRAALGSLPPLEDWW